MNTGDRLTTGDELRTVAAASLRDGQVVTIDGQGYEIDLGYTLVAPSAAHLDHGDNFTVTGPSGATTFTFSSGGAVTGVPIPFNSSMNSIDIARAITQAVQVAGVTPVLVENRVNLVGATAVTMSAGMLPDAFIEGAAGVQAQNIPVPLNSSMSRIQVANVLKSVLESAFTDQVLLADDGSKFLDGETFVIDDTLGNAVTFEFDSGFSLLVPAAGGNLATGGIADGDTFTITDRNHPDVALRGVNTVTFEFDKDGSFNPAHRRIAINDGQGRLPVLQTIEQAINNLPATLRQALGLAPRIITGGIQIVGAPGTTFVIESKPFTPVRVFSAEQTDNGALPVAVQTGLEGAGQITSAGFIGDGPHGTTSGDYDWYRVANVDEGQTITVSIDAVKRAAGSSLDSVVGIYSATGTLLAINDDDGHSTDSFLAFTAPRAGDYYVVVHGAVPQAARTTFSQTTPTVIGLGTFQSTLSVAGLTSNVTELEVALDITHTRDSDLEVFLISPAGTRVELFRNLGGNGQNFTATRFDDQAAYSIRTGTAPFTGRYRPVQPLSSFQNEDGNGIWRLEIIDNVPGFTGNLNSWSLQLATQSKPVLSSATGFFQTNVNNAASGTGAVTGGPYDLTIRVDSSLRLPRAMPSPENLNPLADDGSRLLATNAGAYGIAQSRGVVNAVGVIGDGPFGTTTGDYDWYRIPAVTAGQTLTIDVDAVSLSGGSTLDSKLELYGPNFTLVAANDNDGLSTDSFLIHRALTSGDYFVVIHGSPGSQTNPANSGSGQGVGSTGPYEARITVGIQAIGATATGANEADDRLSQATLTGLIGSSGAGIRTTGFIGGASTFATTSGDYDWYRLTAIPAGQMLTVDVNAVTRRGGSNLNSYVGLYNAVGQLLASNDDDGVTTDSFLTFPIPATGDYYVVVHGTRAGFQTDVNNGGSGQGADSTGVYDLIVQLNNELLTARPVTPTEAVSGSNVDDGAPPTAYPTGISGKGAVVIEGTIGDAPASITNGDYDWYSLAVGSGQKIMVKIETPAGSTLNPEVGIFNSSGKLSDTQTPVLNRPDGYLFFLPPTAGTYYVVVHGSRDFQNGPPFSSNGGTGVGTLGDYTLTVVVDSDPVGPQMLTSNEETGSPDDGSFATATRVPLSGRGSLLTGGQIGNGLFGNTSGDFDHYRLPAVQAGTRITVDLNAVTLPGFDPLTNPNRLDTSVGIYNAAGTLLASNLDDGETTDRSLSYVVTTGGDYFIVVHGSGAQFQLNPNASNSGTGAGTRGRYELLITLDDVVLPPGTSIPQTEDDGALGSANPTNLVAPGIVVASGRIGDGPHGATSGDADWYRIDNTQAGQVITVDVDAVVLARGSQLDSAVLILDANGFVVAANDDDGVSNDSRLTYPVPTGGTYYVVVQGNGTQRQLDPLNSASGLGAGTTGPYQLKISLLDFSFPVSDTGLARGFGEPGVGAGNERVFFAQTASFQANEVAQNIAAAIDRSALSVDNGGSVDPVASSRRVTLRRSQLVLPDLLLDPGTTVIDFLENTSAQRSSVNPIKQHEDLLRIIGHNVNDPGPMGLEAGILPGDQVGPCDLVLGRCDDPFGLLGVSRVGFFSPERGQRNNAEGVYFDDIIIGFAERGETVTAASPNTNFVLNPQAPTNQINVGEYQLEIRIGTRFLGTGVNLSPGAGARSFNTNDRFMDGLTLIAPSADKLADGQQFKLTDGIKEVIFEYDDLSLPLGHPQKGVTQGTVAIGFNPLISEPDYVIAARIRDAINDPETQAEIEVMADTSDGFLASPRNQSSTSNRVNLFGPVSTQFIDLRLTVDTVTADANRLRDVLVGGDPNITPVGDARYIGGSRSAALFRGGLPTIGIDSGVLLTTGLAIDAEGPNRGDGTPGGGQISDYISSGAGDSDLDAEFGLTTTDATVLEFTIDLASNDLFMNFVFASEEYNEFVRGSFNDVVALFINGQNFALVPNTTTPVSINTINGGNPIGTNAVNPQYFNNNDLDDGGQYLSQIGYDGFTTLLTASAIGIGPGRHTIKLAISDVGTLQIVDPDGNTTTAPDQIVDSGLFLQPFSTTAPGAGQTTDRNRIAGVRFGEHGDPNHFRDQGQIVLESNTISFTNTFGINIDAGARDNEGGNSTPHQGPPRNLRELNTARLAPGVVAMNNVLYENLQGGIRFSGDNAGGANRQPAAVPFGRLINNTIVGTTDPATVRGTGILVENNASPTLLNNILVGLVQGVNIDATSRTSVVGANLYQANTLNTNFTAEDFRVELPAQAPLFVSRRNANFYIAPQSLAIDSAVDSLLDRDDLTRVKRPLGIADSPILSPDLDVTGQLRIDDPTAEPPLGFGESVFADRGAFDRADFIGPSAGLVSPRDDDADGLDLRRPAPGIVQLVGVNAISSSFSIRLNDGVPPADPVNGAGVDGTTVTSAAVTVTRDGVLLQDNVDYSFSYNATSDTIRLTPISGVWKPDAVYVVTLNNTDRYVLRAPAGNQIQDADPAANIPADGFIVRDADGNVQRFEFESGYTLHLPKTLTLQVPDAGGRLGGVRDGETFTISYNDGTTSLNVLFEFDKGDTANPTAPPVLANPGAVPIRFFGNSSQNDVAVAIVNALTSTGLRLLPVNLGRGQIHLGSAAGHTLTLTSVGPSASTLVASGVSGSVVDGDTFTISDGIRTVRFEFDINGTTRRDTIPIAFTPQLTHEQIGRNVAAAIRSAIDLGLLDATDGTGNIVLKPVHLGDGMVSLGGADRHQVRTSLSQALTQTGQPGVQQAFGIQARGAALRLQIPSAGLRFLVPATGGQTFNDGDTFTLIDSVSSSSPPVVFEFDSNNSVTPGRQRIAFANNSNQNTLANAIVTALNGARGLLRGTINPTNLGGGVVRLGSSEYLLDLSGVRNASGQPKLGQTGISDGQTFTIDDGVVLRTFEYDVQPLSAGGVQPGHIRVPFTALDSAGILSLSTISIVNGSGLSLNPAFPLRAIQQTVLPQVAVVDAGEALVGGLPHLWNTSRSNLIQTGQSGGIRDGETFSVTRTVAGVPTTVTFEFDANASQIPGNVLILFSDGFSDRNPGAASTAEDVANAMVPILQASGLNLNPVHPGLGRIDLGATTEHTLTLANAPHLSQVGVVGQLPAVPVPYLPTASFTSSRVAISMIEAIESATTISSTALPGGGADVYVDGSLISPTLAGVEPFGSVFSGTRGNVLFRPAIKDRAQNDLKPNLLSGETQFTVLLGDVELDYGDANDPRYPTSSSNNGAAHALRNGLKLGKVVDGERDGQPTAVAIGDDADGFIDLASLPANLRAALPLSPPHTLRIAAGGVVDGETFTITNELTGNAVTFQFALNPATVPAGRVAVPFATTSTLDLIAENLVTAIRSQLPPNGTALTGLNPAYVGQGVVTLGGTKTHSVDLHGSSLTSWGEPAYELIVPELGQIMRVESEGLILHAPVYGGSVIRDGDRFTLLSGANAVIFEFDSNNAVTSPNVRVPFLPGNDQDQIGQSLLEAITGATVLGLRPTRIGGAVQLGSVQYTVTIPPEVPVSRLSKTNVSPFALQLPARGGEAIFDGDTFTIRKGDGAPVTFEYDSNGLFNGNNVRIDFSFFSSQDELANTTANAIRGVTSLGLAPTSLGGGIVLLREPNSRLDLTRAPGLSQSGLSDGQTFTIDDGSRVVTFELDTDGVTTSGNPVIEINDDVLLNVNALGGAAIADGETFTIRRLVSATPGGLINDVVIRATFEFNKDAFFVDANLDGIPDNTLINITSLNTAAQVVNLMQAQIANFRDSVTGLGLGVVPVPTGNSLLLDESTPKLILDTSMAPGLTVSFQPRTRDEIGAAFVQALRSAPLIPALQPSYLGQGYVNPGLTSRHSLSSTGSNLLLLGTPGGPVDGQSFSISNATTTVVYEFDQNGNSTIGRVVVPVTYKYALQIPAGGSSAVREGDQFLVEVAGVGQVFEFNSDGILAFPGNLPIDISSPRTQDELAQSIVTTINNVFPAARPRYLGTGRILLDLDAAVVGNRVDTSGSVGLRHYFTDDVAQAVANVATPTGVRLSNLQDRGRVHVDGGPSHTVDLTGSTRLSLLGQLPKTLFVPVGQGFADGETFTLSDGSRTVVFEFDANGVVTEGRTPIDLQDLRFDADNDGVLLGQEAAQLIVAAVNAAGLAIRAVAPADGQIFFQADDEDGVQFASGLIPSKMSTVYVDSSSVGYVDAWIDFNQDGDWNDAGEQIFASQPVEAGLNTLSFMVPTDAAQGGTTARFRLSSLGGLRPTGLASDGEVEDHAIRVITNVAPTVTTGNGSIVLGAVNEDSLPLTVDLGPNGLDVFQDPDLTNGNGDRLQLRIVSVSNPTLLVATTSGMELGLRFAPDQNGTAQIVVEAIDQAGETARSTVSITVTPVNDAPVTTGTASSNVVVNEDSAPILVDMATFFQDVDILTNNDRLSYSILSNDNTALASASLSGSTLRLEFGADRNGVARIAVQAQDLNGATAFNTVTVTVNAQNDAPRAGDDIIPTTEDQRITTFNVLNNDLDPDVGDALTVIQAAGSNTLTGVSQLGATVSITAGGILTYDPTNAPTIQALAQNATAQDRFTYQVRDNGGLTATATVTINLTGINDAPVARDDSPQVDKNATVAISVTANDTDPEGNALLVTQVNSVLINQGQTLTLPSGARVTRNANNVLTYNPNGVYNNLTSGQTAIDSFTYTVIDTFGAPATANVRVTVRGPNTPPVAVNDLRTTDEQTSIAINVLSNDTDADGHVLSLQSFDVAGTIGVVTRVGNQLVYNPNGRFESLGVGETATDQFRYTVVDTEGGTSVGTVTVTINGVNDPPIAVNDGYIAFRGQSFSTTDVNGSTTPTNQQDDGLLANDSDVDGDPLTISVLVQPRYGTLTMNANGTFTYVHNGSTAVVDTFTYEVSDGPNEKSTLCLLKRTASSGWTILASSLCGVNICCKKLNPWGRYRNRKSRSKELPSLSI